MEWLNYHHLFYFWVVAREGGLTPAGKVLRLSHPTLSAQVHTLEKNLGVELFTKVGRRLVLTATGHTVFRYADEIFALGREMVDTIQGRATGKPLRLNVGVADPVPKLIVKRLLEPAFELGEAVHLVCREDRHDQLLAQLALHALDVVIADAPVPPGSSVRAFHHLLGESGVSIFGVPKLANKFRRGFPKSLEGAPMLLPLDGLPLRRSLNAWFDQARFRPTIAAEFEDNALLEVFGAAGVGLFPASSAVARDVKHRYGAELVGHAEGVRERYYAISAERRLRNPAVVAISEAARLELFAD